MEIHDASQSPKQPPSSGKAPVVRGARACTTCRQAKMKCVGAEDGLKQCQRCKRSNVECIFEKHRRGRKPGSKLSEASKMLRKLEKGLHAAKKNASSSASGSFPGRQAESSFETTFRPDRHGNGSGPNLSPLPSYLNGADGAGPIDVDEDDEDQDRNEEAFFPAKMIRKERGRNSFFRTILNPEDGPTPPTFHSDNRFSFEPPRAIPNATALNDPLSAGLIDNEEAKILFDAFFIRLNSFINLFDPALHTVTYVREKCPFLFTAMIMAACKFFRPELYKPCHKLAREFAARAFIEGWKRVEVVQAFACLTYWKEPDDNCTWRFIGYACRLSVELGLNRYVPNPPPQESETQLRERRNRERTYLVLFVHDRSLSTQTGRNWMLAEDDFIRHASNWHEQGGSTIRPEDVIVAAFVQLRRIAAETTEIFHTSKSAGSNGNTDVNHDIVLRNCNNSLTKWMNSWQAEMLRAGGESFHFSFLSVFRLYVRLFLNSFGTHEAMNGSTPSGHSVKALSICYTSAIDSLKIVAEEFSAMSMLRYGQETITIMSAYSAVFLLQLLRNSSMLLHLHEDASTEIYAIISKTADAYHEASRLCPASDALGYHARFLRNIAGNDIFKTRRTGPVTTSKLASDSIPIDPSLRSDAGPRPELTPQLPQPPQSFPPNDSHYFPPNYSERSRMPIASAPPSMQYMPPVPQHSSESDAQYWRNMFTDLGFGGNVDSAHIGLPVSGPAYSDVRHQLPYQMPQNFGA